ncbi:MAG: hypothetical protein JXR96_14100 [Deltaproteobacteria bacterium]|nr:hypothetical protein [Deltaproteobacteria bacterium]
MEPPAFDPRTYGRPATPTKTSGLAITAFVLSLFFIIPLLPLLGTVLGIVALATHRPDRGGKGLAIAAIPVGLAVTLVIQGIMAAVAIPAFIQYTRRAKASEVYMYLDKARSGLTALQPAVGPDGSLGSPLPAMETGWIPAEPCCDQPQGHCSAPAETWQRPPWDKLRFSVEPPSYFQWRFRSDGQSVTVEARGDMDCDGQYSSYTLEGRWEGGQVQVDPMRSLDDWE